MGAQPIVAAALEFQSDEQRRRKRGQRPRLSAEGTIFLAGALASIKAGVGQVDEPRQRSRRGTQAVDLFGYEDTFDEKAATVVTDILHAAATRGYSPQGVLNQAAAYYAEEAGGRIG